jgi:ATP-dependent exoDNAse (exonuclease V) alpha subunit
MKSEVQLCEEQINALNQLNSGENVFLTGQAGSGKSFLIREFIKEMGLKDFPILASTGAAAVLVGGRTFHSFFGLGLLEGGPEKVKEKAFKDGKLKKRLSQIEGIIIDEVSMIGGEVLNVAEEIARHHRGNNHPFGGLRVIAIGDFAQLPPITKSVNFRDWCFKHPVWQRTQFQMAYLKTNHRTEDQAFLKVLNFVREGIFNQEVGQFLQAKTKRHDENASGVRLFPFRKQSEDYNLYQLNKIKSDELVIPTIFWGENLKVDKLKHNFPFPEELKIKIGAEIIFTQNDPQKRWINGTQGKVVDFQNHKFIIEKKNGRDVTVDKVQFDFLNGDGEVVVSAVQYPLALGYATTIHKSQGATLDELWCDLGRLWEPGQAYVALSRLKTSQGLNLIRWTPGSIKADRDVLDFYRDIKMNFT